VRERACSRETGKKTGREKGDEKERGEAVLEH